MGTAVFVTVPKSNRMVGDPGHTHADLRNRNSFKKSEYYNCQHTEGNGNNPGMQINS